MLKKACFVFCFFSFFIPSIGNSLHPDRYASIVIDAKTGEVIHAEKATKLRSPASLTKMMTLYVVFKKLDEGCLKLNDIVHVSKAAALEPPTRMGLNKGDKVTVKDIIYGMIVHSANDGAHAIAEHISKTEENFVKLMNKEALFLGMKNSTFYNSHGLPHASQLTTARDMAILCKALYDHFPHHTHFFATEKFSFKGKPHRNHNKLLGRYKGFNGVKTGYTCRSGFNLAASVVRDSKHLFGVVLGGKNPRWRDRRMEEIIDAGFSRFSQDKPKVYLVSSKVQEKRGVHKKHQSKMPQPLPCLLKVNQVRLVPHKSRGKVIYQVLVKNRKNQPLKRKRVHVSKNSLQKKYKKLKSI